MRKLFSITYVCVLAVIFAAGCSHSTSMTTRETSTTRTTSVEPVLTTDTGEEPASSERTGEYGTEVEESVEKRVIKRETVP